MSRPLINTRIREACKARGLVYAVSLAFLVALYCAASIGQARVNACYDNDPVTYCWNNQGGRGHAESRTE